MILLNWNFELDIKKDLLYNSSFKMKKKTIENTFIQWKRKISSDIELISNFYPSPMFPSSKLLKKKIILLLLLRTKNFHRAEKEREKCDNYYQPQKKREEREAKVRNWTVYFSRRDVSASKRGRNEGRERERGKQTRGKVRHGFGSRVVVVESSEPSQNRERAKKSCLAAITRPGAKGSNRKSTEERGVPRSRKLMN